MHMTKTLGDTRYSIIMIITTNIASYTIITAFGKSNDLNHIMHMNAKLMYISVFM